MAGRIGVAITSRNRRDVFNRSYAEWKRFLPDGAVLVVVDDASDVPIPEATYRFDTNVGIARGKNKSLELLMDAGCQSLYLADDDVYPTSADWYEPYTRGAEPAYSYCWSRFARDKRPVPKMDVIYKDPDLIGYGWSMGCLQYVERHVIDRVGGFNPAFGLAFEEHIEFFERIHAAGFTTFTHQDAPAMKGRVWAGDEHYAVQRSFKPQDAAKLVAKNTKLRESLAGSTDYVEYRQPRDIILTSYFTGQLDPQRHRRAQPDPTLLRNLYRSTADHNLVVLHDHLPGLPPKVEGHKVAAPMCAYQQRWVSQYQYLRAHPEIRWVWLVDATDVIVLNDPFANMEPGTLYAGCETTTISCDWITKHCPPEHKAFMDAHANDTLINTGLVGGDRQTVMDVCRKMSDLWVASDRKNALYEMAFYQVVGYSHPKLVFGDTINTPFKEFRKSDPVAKFAHK